MTALVKALSSVVFLLLCLVTNERCCLLVWTLQIGHEQFRVHLQPAPTTTCTFPQYLPLQSRHSFYCSNNIPLDVQKAVKIFEIDTK